MMKRSTLSLAVAAAIAVSGNASAWQSEEMEKTLQDLQAQVVAMQSEIAKMKAEQGQTSSAAEWTNSVSIGGAVEFVIPEGGAGTLDTLELELGVQVTDATSAYVKLEKQADDSVNVDEASVTHDFGVAAVSATTGGHPFGDYSTNMISDPLTKTIGDTGGSAKLIVEVPVGENTVLTGAVDDDIHTVAVTVEMGDLSVGAGHINKIGGDDVDDTTKSANNLFASYTVGDFSMVAEAVDSDGTSDATNVELAYGFSLAGHEAAVALGRTELKNDTSAEKRNMFAVTVNLDEGLDLSVEKMDSDISANDAWSAKIAYGF